MWCNNDWRSGTTVTTATTATTGAWEEDDGTFCSNNTYYEYPKPDQYHHFSARLSDYFIPAPIRKFVSLLFGREVDKHVGGYQKNGKRRAWTGVNFHKVSC